MAPIPRLPECWEESKGLGQYVVDGASSSKCIGEKEVGTSFCSLCHACAMNIQQWWSSIFEASLVGIERELGIVWCVYMQPRHSRASIWTKNHVKLAFSAFFIALNANLLNSRLFRHQPEGPKSVFGPYRGHMMEFRPSWNFLQTWYDEDYLLQSTHICESKNWLRTGLYKSGPP